jgi:hypothetical protein
MVSLAFSCFFLMLAMPVHASSGFLHPSTAQTLTPEQKSVVLATIEEALGQKHRKATEVRIAPIEELLAPTLNALPKNEHGKFGHKAARYALHRFFVKRHAWFVKGIDLSGDLGGNASNATPTGMLQDGVPDEVQTLFESRLGAEGLDAHEVAVMAATLENLVHAESMDRLRMAYKAKGLAKDAKTMTGAVADAVLDIYMASYVTGFDLSQNVNDRQGAARILALAEAMYPGFEDVRKFVRDIRHGSISHDGAVSIMDMSQVVTRIGDKYGRWQHYECDDLKRKLFALEDDGTGRVSLTKFYGGALNHGHWQFSESPDYLRSMGALDESTPTNPRVIVSNYILSPSNCVASSSYYSVCCLDECEDLVDRLEREIKAPAATPELIASLVAVLPSSTTPANRTIPAHLLERLDQIAAGNEGLVPLHGRMFAQWMHHVYPRECIYPHLSGTFNAMRLEEYEKETGQSTSMTEEVMREYIADAVEPESVGEIVWTHDDEFYVEQAPPAWTSFRDIVRFIVFFIPAFSTAFFLLRMSRASGAEANLQAHSKSHYV